jgi:hypothetical protein
MLPDSLLHKGQREASRNSRGDDYNHNITFNATYVDENIRLAKPPLRIFSY